MLARRKMYFSFGDIFKLCKFLIKGQDEIIVSRLEKKLSAYFGNRDVITTSSGREAILLGLKSLGLSDGDEIIVPALTLGELIPLLKKQGYKIVLADICPKSLNVTVDSLKNKVSDQTKCIMVTHLFGVPAEIDEIIKFSNEKGIPVLEDCAHTMFASYDDQPLGAWGDAAILSFEGNKPLPAYGGGALILKSQAKAQEIRDSIESLQTLKLPISKKLFMTIIEEVFLMSPFFKPVASILFSEKFQATFEKHYRGMNDKVRPKSRFTSFQAEIALENYEVFSKKQIANIEKKLSFEKMIDANIARVQSVPTKGKPSFYNSTIIVKETGGPKRLKNILFKNGYDSGFGSEVIDCCDKYFDGEFNSPNAKWVEEQILLLPIHERAENRDILRISKVVNNAN
ncbi:aminotransferase class I/II-fold pyridoxal phosphate-dependent enzyme [Bacteriovorax sp. Seq25_V]|uniref:aminotransferase class I/II-fold pyridoxal phosphate-dependent enzyme n=1 Tax=Bacteriovorax sp. Seq25_V TaxID=1201288 RepID=UPI00038A2558|nr:aminotransferase class I/II-fold pyridoxal phosphate-dependent enzyme [Bacteriovorax sp. Seq25_V]EQC46926.1 DegT/DnrJ/EryC1/StrS aminotransferase family protein [Bacteriovorax sp. Seq25_V]